MLKYFFSRLHGTFAVWPSLNSQNETNKKVASIQLGFTEGDTHYLEVPSIIPREFLAQVVVPPEKENSLNPVLNNNQVADNPKIERRQLKLSKGARLLRQASQFTLKD
jgi:hypothetical protein